MQRPWPAETVWRRQSPRRRVAQDPYSCHLCGRRGLHGLRRWACRCVSRVREYFACRHRLAERGADDIGGGSGSAF